MKILLIGDASSYHWTLGEALRALGHTVTVASDGMLFQNSRRDIDLKRHLPGPLGGALLYLNLRTLLRRKLRGYDFVQICTPNFLALRPGRVRKVFDNLQRDNGRVILTHLGTDPFYVERLTSANPPLRYSEWAIGNEPTPYALSADSLKSRWLTKEMLDHCRYIYDHVDGAVTALYEYHQLARSDFGADRLAYIGIPIDLREIKPFPLSELNPDTPLRIMMASPKGREGEKGLELLLPALRELEASCHGRIAVEEVSGLPYAQFVEKIKESHIIVDQLYSFTPATTALLAMARGRVTVSGGEPEYYDFIKEKELHPVINADPADISGTMRRIEELAVNPEELRLLASAGPEFVRRHNDSMLVARRLLDFYSRF